MTTKTRIRKKPGFDEFFKSVPEKARGIAVEAAGKYIIGNDRRGLRHEPKYLFVSRTTAYGQPFSSDKQRRWFFASVAAKKNVITGRKFTPGYENRTHTISTSWRMEGNKTKIVLINDAEGNEFVIGKKQAEQPRRAGWRYYMDVVKSNYNGAIRNAQREVDKWIRTKK